MASTKKKKSIKQITDLSFDNLANQYQELKTSIQQHGSDLLKLKLKDVFDANPELEAFKWAQYTRSFDYNVMLFDCDDLQFKLKNNMLEQADGYEEDEDDPLEQEEFYDLWSGPQITPRKLVDDLQNIETYFRNNSHVMFLTFGDLVEITATRHDFEVKEYNTNSEE